MDFVLGILTSDAVASALALLIAVLLGGLVELVRRQLRRVGIEVDQRQEEWLQRKVEEGILLARQLHRQMPDSPERNKRMHQTAISHVRAAGGKAVKKLANDQLDSLVQLGVRRLKKLL